MRWRLVNKSPNKGTGRQHVSSSSDGIVDYAAAVIAKQIPLTGLPATLPNKYYDRAKRLLKKNEVVEVNEKRTPRTNQARANVRRDLKHAFPRIIGQVYKAENEKNMRMQKYLNSKTVIDWLIRSLADPRSRLNSALKKAGYDNLVELKRGPRWWQDTLELSKNRKKAE